MALPTTGSSSAIAGKKSLPTIEVHRLAEVATGSPKLHRVAAAKVASRVAEPPRLSDARARGDIA